MKKRLLSLLLMLCLLLSVFPLSTVQAATQVYYPIDFTDAVYKSGIGQRVTSDCAIVSVATIEAYLHGATSSADKDKVYSAVISANKDNDYAYWSNMGYVKASYSLQALYDQLEKGYPVVVHSQGKNHWSVVCGYTGSTSSLQASGFKMVNVSHSGVDKTTLSSWLGSNTGTAIAYRKNGLGITTLSGIKMAINHPELVHPSGDGHGVYGYVASNSNLTKVTVSVINALNGNTVYSKTVTPNKKTYSPYELDSEMTFAKWGVGQYYYVVFAQDSAGNSRYFTKYFTIATSYPSSAPKQPTYTIAYNANGGTGSMSNSTITYNGTLSPAKCGFTREGYNFVGWTVQRSSDKMWFTNVPGWKTESEISSNDYDKKIYEPGTSYVFNTSWTLGGNGACTYTFYALWEKAAPTRPYYPIDFSDAVLKSGIGQRVTSDCAIVSVATIEAYLHGVTTDAQKDEVYDAVIATNTDNDYAYWNNMGYVRADYSLEALYDQLETGYPVIVYSEGKNHWSVVCGYTGSTTTLQASGFQMVNVSHEGVNKTTLSNWLGSNSGTAIAYRKNGIGVTMLGGIKMAVNYPAVVHIKGEGHGVYGYVTADTNLAVVEVSVVNAVDGSIVLTKRATPNKRYYSPYEFDSEMTFAKWPVGQYYYVVYAQDAAGTKQYFTKYFTIAEGYPSTAPQQPSYTVAYHPNGGAGSMGKGTVTFNTNYSLAENTYTRDGYTFVGWNVYRNADSKWMADGWMTSEEITENEATRKLFADREVFFFGSSWLSELTNSTSTYTFYAAWEKNACEHSYVYSNTDSEVHTVTCALCGDSYIETHSFVDIECICGATEVPEGPEVDQNVKIAHSLNLASDISINYAVKSSYLTDYDRFYLSYSVPKYTGNEITEYTTGTIEGVVNGSYYYFTLKGLNALRMNDMVEATLHMFKGDVEYVSKVDVYSVGTYAYNKLNDANAAEALKKMCANLLQYGAAAQVWKEYRTNALVDVNMTAEHKAYLIDTESITFGTVNQKLGDVANAKVTWVGKALILDSQVAVKYVFDASKFTGDINNLKLVATFTNKDGQKETVTVEEFEVYNEAKKQYAFIFNGLLAAELRAVVNVSIYDGNMQVSESWNFQADQYAIGKTGTLLEMCKALFAYSDSALAYFGK